MPFDIPDWVELPDGKTEEDTHRDGVLSYAVEWHAFTIGIAVGFASVLPLPKLRAFVYHAVGLYGDGDCDGIDTRTQAMKEVRQESHYALGGALIGATLAVALQLLALGGLVGGL